MDEFAMRPIATVRSELKDRATAPRQGNEGAPDAWIDVAGDLGDALHGIEVGQDIILITWFHQADRGVLQVHPRNEEWRPLAGVFATRSPDRPDPLGLHRVRVLEIDGNSLKVGPLEAIDGTPVVDIKPVLDTSADF
jgi:tRNA-Thr(GGU) m(6)t(6)A37 methyltransferase TsaA